MLQGARITVLGSFSLSSAVSSQRLDVQCTPDSAVTATYLLPISVIVEAVSRRVYIVRPSRLMIPTEPAQLFWRLRKMQACNQLAMVMSNDRW